MAPKPKKAAESPPVELPSKSSFLADSEFFKQGFYKKAKACPELYTKRGETATICGEKVTKGGKWDPRASIEQCPIEVSADKPVMVETKFNGHRGIFEMHGGKYCFFSKRKGCNSKPLPAIAGKVLSEYLQSRGVHDAILDGEMFVERCVKGEKIAVPEIGQQTRAIKGDNYLPVLKNCTFTYKVFDAINIDGKDISAKSLIDRKKALAKLIPKPVSANIGDLAAEQLGRNIGIDPIMPVEAASKAEIAKLACKAIKSGEEGIVMKEGKGTYEWIGNKEGKESREGWWKMKEYLDVDAEVDKACLGNVGKTGENALVYHVLHLGICADENCKELVPVSEAASSVNNGDFSGVAKWNKNVQQPILKLLSEGKATPIGNWRSVDDVVNELASSGKEAKVEKLEKLTGGITNEDGKPALPGCVELPRGFMIVSVVGTDINVEKGIPVLQGPPKLNVLRKLGSNVIDKSKPNTVDYVLGMAK